MVLNVRLHEGGRLLEFTTAHAVLKATDAASTGAALDAADAALRDGYWIAGYLSYEPGCLIGVFDPPAEAAPHAASFALSPLLPRIDMAAYAAAVKEIRARIYDGDVYQVNYTVPFDLHILGDTLALWHAVGTTTGAQYQAYLEHDGGSILSWSPELFLRFDGDRVITKPMKGTAPGSDIARLSDAKNRAEHIMIVDLLRNDLRRVCNDVEVEALCTIEQYPRFVTMTSTISGTGTASLREIFSATFPSGSITGAPKRAALRTIAALERWPRGVYCGSIGYLSPQRRGWWNVAIRTAQIDRDGVGRYDAGGGIVIDSDAGDEWHEVLLKAAFLSAFSEPLELLETLAADATPDVVEAHLARLLRAAHFLRIPLNHDALQHRLYEAMTSAGYRSLLRVRVQHDGSHTIRAEPLIAPELPVRIGLSGIRVRSDDPFLRIKSAWRPAANAALAFAQANNCFDALLHNERDEVTEGSRTSLFVEIGGTLYTPPLECGVLPGILRSRIVTEGRAHERVLTANDLGTADAIYVGNSARGLLPAKLI